MERTSLSCIERRAPRGAWGRVLAVVAVLAAPSLAHAQGEDIESDQRAMESEPDAEADRARVEEEEETARRPGWKKFFWVDAVAAYSFANLEALDYQELVPERVSRSGSGFSTGLGAGFRLFFLTVGARYTFSDYADFNLSGLTGELGIRIPTPIVEPFLRAAVGYGWLDADFGEIDPNIDGAVIDVGAGFDVWVHPYVTVGLAFQTAFFLLDRDAIEACLDGECGEGLESFGEEGDAAAVQARVELRVGVHI